MLSDPDLRNVADDLGDYVSFELFDGQKWQLFGVSGTALRLLGGPHAISDIESFEQNFERIKGVAFGIKSVDDGRTIR